MATCNQQDLITAAAQAGFNQLSPQDQWAVINQLLCNILANGGGGGPGGPFLPLAGGTMTGVEAFTGGGALASPPMTGTVTLTKLSGANGPLQLINGGPWVDPGSPTQPVAVWQPVNPGIGINMDLMPKMTSSATRTIAIDLVNTDLRFAGTTNNATWLHLAIGADGNYYVGGDFGSGGVAGSLVLQETGKPVGIGNFGQRFSNRVVPYYFTVRPYTTTLNFGVEIDTEATGMQLHSINDAGTRLPLSTVTSNLVFANNLAAGQRTKFLTIRPLTNVNLDVHNTVETGTATTAVEISALADDETTQKALVARALRFEFVPGGSSGRLQLQSAGSGAYVSVFSDDGAGGNRPILFGNSTITPLTPFQFHPSSNINVSIDSTGAVGRLAAFNDAGSTLGMRYLATSHFFNTDGTGTQRTYMQFRPATGVNVGIDNTGTSGRIQAFDDSAAILGMVYKASSNFFDFDGTATKLLAGTEFRLATNVRAAFDSNSSVARLFSFNDAGTATAMQYLASKHTFAATNGALTVAGGAASPLFRVAGNGLSNELLGFTNNDLYLSCSAGTAGSATAATTSNPNRIFSSHYNGTSYAITSNIATTPTGTHSGSDRGVAVTFQTIPTGSTTLSTALTIDGSQNLIVANTAKGNFQAAGTATTCTGATIGTGSKANAGFVTATTTGVSTVVVTFPFTAATGWAISVSNNTTANLVRQSASSTTTATFTGTTVTGDVLSYVAMAY